MNDFSPLPPLPERPSLSGDPPRPSTPARMLARLSGCLIAASVLIPAILIGRELVLLPLLIFGVGGLFHYLVWGRRLGAALQEESQRDPSQPSD